ncbi:hemin uptake protein HemP [Halorhodospira halochloris]|uniref:hemin uptake protein HemP n=1 Tax=Halorhodospira halochloris TaxID=1052 RepID=UPI000BBB246C|nr:hypothetical protein [Halorhodospira halochloris]
MDLHKNKSNLSTVKTDCANTSVCAHGGEELCGCCQGCGACGRSKRPNKFSSEELFCGCRQLIIVHGEQEYRLQQTRQGKLILTK